MGESAAAGGGAIHRLSGGVRELATPDPAAALDGHAVKWTDTWGRTPAEGKPAWDESVAPSDAAELPPIAAPCVARAIRKLRLTAGVGFRCLQPSLLKLAPDEAVADLAALYSEVEADRVCPTSWQQVKMPLIPKGNGGKRTVVLTPILYRVMLSARRADLRVWDDANGSSDDAACPGIGAERAVERAAAEMDMLRAQRRAAVTALWDVAAFFDSLGLRRV